VLLIKEAHRTLLYNTSRCNCMSV